MPPIAEGILSPPTPPPPTAAPATAVREGEIDPELFAGFVNTVIFITRKVAYGHQNHVSTLSNERPVTIH